MFYYDRTDLSKGTDLAKSNNSRKECIIFNYWFLITDSNFKILYAMVVMF